MKKHPLYDRGRLSEQTNNVLKALQQNPMSIEELINELDLTKNQVLTSLDRLERSHQIWRKQGRYRAKIWLFDNEQDSDQ